MPLGEHLEELRRRLAVALLGLVPAVVLALVFGRAALELVIAPAQNALAASGRSATLQATSPLETFGAYIRVAILLGLLMASPWVLYQLWRFVAPGLYRNERRFVHLLIPLSSALSLGAITFLYSVIMPIMLTFFIGFGSTIGTRSTPIVEPDGPLPTIAMLEGDPADPAPGELWYNAKLNQLRLSAVDRAGEPVILGTGVHPATGIRQDYKIADYVKLFFSLGIAFVIGFQMPVVILLLGKLGLVTVELLAKVRRYAIIGCAVAGAFLTPADPVSMVALAVPLYALYELGGLLLRLMPPRAWDDFDDDLNDDMNDDMNRDLRRSTTDGQEGDA